MAESNAGLRLVTQMQTGEFAGALTHARSYLTFGGTRLFIAKEIKGSARVLRSFGI
jgi:hypothetical protein